MLFQVFDGENWQDKTDKILRLSRQISSRELEKLEFEILGDVSVGQKVRLIQNNNVIFEGVVYEKSRRHGSGEASRCEATAYSDLILYDRHVVFREYGTGTKAGDIIKDLAGLESGVDTTNVDDGPSLNSPWSIQNQPALAVMKSVARGTNYWLRMKPGKILYFKPKTIEAPKATITIDNTISAEYSEDRWKLKNRVIYVGAGGRILADVSEPPGDLPVVVHDPFLTDAAEAYRRAQIRLALNREYGRQLRVEVHKNVFESWNVDLGDTLRVNLPSLGLENVDMYLVEIEYDPGEMKYVLTLGGRLELFEEFFEERVGGDVAARFGQTVSIAEIVSSTSILIESLQAASRIQAVGRTVRAVNSPPLVWDSAQNVTLDENGYVKLMSGFTTGSFEWGFTPDSELFRLWLRVIYLAENGDGNVSVSLLRGNDTIASNIPSTYDIPRYPKNRGEVDEGPLEKWDAVGGTITKDPLSLISAQSVKIMRTGASVEAFYPTSQNLGLNVPQMKYFTVYLYSPNDGNVEVRLYTDPSNYRRAAVTLVGGVWRRYEIIIPTMQTVGNPSTINWFSFVSSDLLSFNVDTDYVFLSAKKERLALRFELSRPSAHAKSPVVKIAKLVWREGR